MRSGAWSVCRRRRTTSAKVDSLRILATISGLIGAFFFFFAAGASDAGLLSVGELIARIAFGASLILFWRALSFFANELDRRARSKR